MERRLILTPVPGFLVRILLGEFGNVLLEGQRVIPRRLVNGGYRFRFAILEDALKDPIGNKM
jgi:uncharacterized protein